MKSHIRASKYCDMVGQRYGKLVVLSVEGKDKDNHTFIKCRCDCGATVERLAYRLKQGMTKSCGCNRYAPMQEVSTKHGQRHTRLYRTWGNMKSRCTNPKTDFYDSYGGRGIKVCEIWKNDFMAFYDWAHKNGYTDELFIDRIDNNGNYEPSNCRWVNMSKQANNRTTNVVLNVNGMKLTVSEVCDRFGINKSTLYSRIRRGYEVDEWIASQIGEGRES